MRHQKEGRKFGRITGRRRSFLAILMHNLIMEGRIQTTEARAKEIKPRVERLITIAKKGDLSALKLLLRRIPKDSAYKLYHEIAPKYKDRNGGYLRIIKTSEVRKRDGVMKVVIEFV
ncbi:MAG: 50S ribosomal protein L17 [Parcubacteria group bacterium GW2011_GWA1_50_14]|uniref:50S ribosomal protein L17 n=2 Tax=Candidatus Colwelliibacteriota TaxID=1817904 RepID=A0A1G1ZEH7_9BACT|nr:MAG: 50S ribosomal protein L17 [Parcubacteria group bacterium GW2011_GWA1_50_14]OGY57431.1 MAG: 50S ribosomal protein L17 [Candidatus Colwellbacteria bacterium RIFCSPHIGHO2_02_FULL_45_17]OGY61049.1 MAG: 50S ribosomal protein L17 [Candidatus Colwellbacteria bacterium RIFCSPLOWO2_02_FULL_45_11]OGY62536.1 MAG: 50S ribosomal protein L17 [Candidatus Colwellbacteria bacterium RIFCSPLOWO2_12_FULL_46_17]